MVSYSEVGFDLIYNLCTEILLWFILSLQFRSEKHKGQSYVVLLCIHMYVGVSVFRVMELDYFLYYK